ncbi:ISAs1 family transposase [Streptomyces sp. H27-H1]|uniref:ISAs1 family transposase n=1 Tax=Streptomyces sp. H27-H1 TaxID=2996461 RepID=UPI00226EF665|nr:ISAs1 family transposase [Streptomyces sp. H27-H1]MCY0932573.1 ISAs1 family transposase [Streptomyces sp. H27-H1]
MAWPVSAPGPRPCSASASRRARRPSAGVLNAVCPGGLADLLGAGPAGGESLAVDGKSARGSGTCTTAAAHVLAAMTGTGLTVTQLRVPDKTNEITCFAALLEPFDLAGVTVTADALHTQRREHARFLVEGKQAHYLLVVKANQPRLHHQLRRRAGKSEVDPGAMSDARTPASVGQEPGRSSHSSSATRCWPRSCICGPA